MPYIAASSEIKTKPTQHSVKELRSIGIQPDILVCRSERPLPDEQRAKIALFTNVEERAVISAVDVDNLYKIPLVLNEQHLDDIVVDKLGLDVPSANLSKWESVVEAHANPEAEIEIAMVGKYMDIRDSYISLTEALLHAGIQTRTRVNIRYVESEELEANGNGRLHTADAILVPGGFGDRGIEGKISAVKLAREKQIPYLGICLGLQVAVIEYARNVAGLTGAHSTEFQSDTPDPVIALITEWPCGSARKPAISPRAVLPVRFTGRTRSTSVTVTATSSITTTRHCWPRRDWYSPAVPKTISRNSSSYRTIHGSWPANSTPSSRPTLSTGTRCSPVS